MCLSWIKLFIAAWESRPDELHWGAKKISGQAEAKGLLSVVSQRFYHQRWSFISYWRGKCCYCVISLCFLAGHYVLLNCKRLVLCYMCVSLWQNLWKKASDDMYFCHSHDRKTEEEINILNLSDFLWSAGGGSEKNSWEAERCGGEAWGSGKAAWTDDSAATSERPEHKSVC